MRNSFLGYLKQSDFSEKISFNEFLLKKLIKNSHKKIVNLDEKGSSTLCSAYIDNESHMLYTGYIGDSLYMILRKIQNEYRLFYKSPEMIKDFNAPYHIGYKGDNPSLIKASNHKLKKDDIVILASDG